MRDDLELTLGLLAYNLKLPIRHFSYPEGQPHHYTDAAIAHLKALGVICSPSAVCGLNAPGADLFHLRRVMVGFLGIPFPFQPDGSLELPS
jgi:hypothetical protein